MRDTILETQIRLLTLEVENWKKLHDFITYALDKSKPIVSADQERQFTEIRGLLLQLPATQSGEGVERVAAGDFDSRRARSFRGRNAPLGGGLERGLHQDRCRPGSAQGPTSGVAQPQHPDLFARSIVRPQSGLMGRVRPLSGEMRWGRRTLHRL